MDTEKLNALMKCAYEGTLALDALPPVEYKYLSRVAEVGRKVRANAMTQVRAGTAIGQYYADYCTEARTWEEYASAGTKWAKCIAMTDSLRVHINGSDDPALVASAACRALYEVTGDTMMLAKSEAMAALVEEVMA